VRRSSAPLNPPTVVSLEPSSGRLGVCPQSFALGRVLDRFGFITGAWVLSLAHTLIRLLGIYTFALACFLLLEHPFGLSLWGSVLGTFSLAHTLIRLITIYTFGSPLLFRSCYPLATFSARSLGVLFLPTLAHTLIGLISIYSYRLRRHPLRNWRECSTCVTIHRLCNWTFC